MREYLLILIFASAVFYSAFGQQKEKKLAQPDTAIFYFADRIDYKAEAEKIYLSGNSKLKYKTMLFSAYSIVLDMKNNVVTAGQKEDTLFSKSVPGKIDSIIVTGVPTITEGIETV